jgi:hypothetical protein
VPSIDHVLARALGIDPAGRLRINESLGHKTRKTLINKPWSKP